MRRALLLPCLFAMLGLAACGSDDDGNDPYATAAAGTAGVSTAKESAKPATAGTARALRLAAVGRFEAPVYVTAPPKDKRRIFVVEQGGTIRVVRRGKRLSRPFLDVRDRVIAGGEQGLLSMAFAPDYASTRRFYVNYTDKAGTQSVVEYRRATADRAAPGSARLVLKYDGLEANHNGGLVKFGPDRLLYIATGDGGGGDDRHGSRGNAQDLGSLLGKLLRIDPRPSGAKPYSVPVDNPFTGRSGARPEIYSYGLRNPWRFSFDRSTGDLIIGDVGQNAVEEVDFARRGEAKGANYGWRPYEGANHYMAGEEAPGHVDPVIELSHGDGNCSVTGGYVVRDRGLPSLKGRYVYADFCAGRLRAARLGGDGASGDGLLNLRKIEQISSFGEDAVGRIYVVSLGGPVYRLAD